MRGPAGTHADANGDGHSNSDIHADAYADSDRDANTDGDSDSYTYFDTQTYTGAETGGNQYTRRVQGEAIEYTSPLFSRTSWKSRDDMPPPSA